MKWINAGAKYKAMGANVPSKTALKRALRDAPQDIILYTTGQFPAQEYEVTASDLGNIAKPDEAWQITGPDPYTNRKWYATVTVNHLGNLKVT
jgi:hypothetical protein